MHSFPYHPDCIAVWQPIVPLFPIKRRRPIVGAETLLRRIVRGKKRSFSYRVPFQFLRDLQNAGDTTQLFQLTEGILREACQEAWRAHSLGADLSVSVNVPPILFTTRLVEKVLRILNQMNQPPYSFSPSKLTLEITEEKTGDVSEILNTVDILHDIGVRIAIDDVGAGGGRWMALMKSKHVSTIKIDRKWVVDPAGDHRSVFFRTADLALMRGMRVVLEGIETPTELEQMIEIFEGVPAYRNVFVQGFVFYQPLFSNDFQIAVASSLTPRTR